MIIKELKHDIWLIKWTGMCGEKTCILANAFTFRGKLILMFKGYKRYKNIYGFSGFTKDIARIKK